ncbi:MAG: isovaleryl-CoA dehydrogenase [Deltaproteobacteria bacterium RIFOXYA12_FULL_58_15]|nr:MAG: isovaleryl-CoA dehydrogenase [Deltaproteobacteria bacterium RIFOXYA12_FULL_58_15]OGR08759.1 MAG: isovaleryl-CoA dehydrogenase [Deltaproteobacteria bacterium RIFOXYB12_FULL_58_9]
MTHRFDPYNPTQEHSLLRETVAQFAVEKVAPQAEEHDVSGTMNLALFRDLAELGLLGVTVDEEDGGAGLDATAAVIVHHELAKYDPGFTLAYLAHAMLFVNNFAHSAHSALKLRYLPKVLSGESVACMCMTEPAAGTDVLGMKSHAVRDGNHYIINGAKTFITNAPESDLFYVYAKLDGKVTAFALEREFEGLTVGKPIKKHGMRASTMSEIVFEDVRVPVGNVIGEEGQGLTHMMRNLEIERLTLAAMSLGIADRCLNIMVRYAEERQAFGRSINDFGQIQRFIGESYAKTEAMRALVYNVAANVGPDKRNRLGTDAAKLFCSTAAKQVADNAMQVLGGYGYCQEYHVERLLRDAKLLEIGGGTIESHQKNITRDLTKVMVTQG